jgi:cytochrome c peroxidase
MSLTPACALIAVLAFVLSVKPASAVQLPDPIEDPNFHFNGAYDDNKVVLGGLLFFDKILSGNENISCGTCHHALTSTVDGLPLAIGEGAAGIGIARDLGTGLNAVPERLARNSMSLFNLGHKSFVAAFHDGRIEVDGGQPSGFASPAGNDLPLLLDTVMAAQTLFPLAAGTEMAGQVGENPQADLAAANDFLGVWAHISAKIQAVPDYVAMFLEVFNPAGGTNTPVSQASDIGPVHIANSIFAWEASVFRADNTPFDRYLRGDRRAMGNSAKRGMRLFFSRAGCSGCHSGAMLTDQGFHSIALPQIGPGAGDGIDGHDDTGRERVTGDPADRYRFRTPPLRNVALSAPYGHDGAYDDLETMVRHHMDAVTSLATYDQTQVLMPSRPDLDANDFVVMDDPSRVAAIAASNEVPTLDRALKDKDVASILDFLQQGLTDPRSMDLRSVVPLVVPSGLPVFD